MTTHHEIETKYKQEQFEKLQKETKRKQIILKKQKGCGDYPNPHALHNNAENVFAQV